MGSAGSIQVLSQALNGLEQIPSLPMKELEEVIPKVLSRWDKLRFHEQHPYKFLIMGANKTDADELLHWPKLSSWFFCNIYKIEHTPHRPHTQINLLIH